MLTEEEKLDLEILRAKPLNALSLEEKTRLVELLRKEQADRNVAPTQSLISNMEQAKSERLAEGLGKALDGEEPEDIEDTLRNRFGIQRGANGQTQYVRNTPEDILAHSMKNLNKAGHTPETLGMDDEKLDEIADRDRLAILLRHGKITKDIATNLMMLSMYHPTVERQNIILYDNSEIDETQFLKNEMARSFCEEAFRSAVDALSAVDGYKMESLKTNVAAGVSGHNALDQAEAEKSKNALRRAKDWLSGNKNE